MERRRNIEDLDSYLEETIKNIRDDRAVTSALLADIMVFLKKYEQNHKEAGNIAAKYVETLQRSNEQLVKVAGIIQKKQTSLRDGLSDSDKQEIFDIIGTGGD